MVLHAVAFLSNRACFYITSHKHSGKGDRLRTITCHNTVVGASKGMLPIKCLHSGKSFSVSVELDEDHETVLKMK